MGRCHPGWVLSCLLSMLLLPGIVWAAAPGSPVKAATSGGSVKGTVVDKDGILPGVVVTISGPTLPQPKTSVTDAQGAFTFAGLPAGTYEIKASLGGGEPVTVSGVVVKAGQENKLDP